MKVNKPPPVNKPPGGIYNVKPPQTVGRHVINTGWTDDKYRPIYLVAGRFMIEEEVQRRGILEQPKRGSSPVWTPFNLGKLGR